MSLTPSNVYDNPMTPGVAAEIYLPDQLIAGPFQIVSHQGTMLAGQGVLPRGTMMGKQTVGAATSAAKAGGNTGNGTATLVSSKGAAQIGVYALRVAVAGANAATWNLYSPAGDLIDQRSYATSGGTAVFNNDQIAATLTDGSTDFVVGDGFDITVVAGSAKYVKSVATATDGTQYPSAILADQADTTAGDVLAGVYLSGEFNLNAVTYDTSWTQTNLQAAARLYSIFLKVMSLALSNIDPT